MVVAPASEELGGGEVAQGLVGTHGADTIGWSRPLSARELVRACQRASRMSETATPGDGP